MLLTLLATLPFMAALGLAAIALNDVIGSNLPKIMAALRGKSPLAEAVATRPVTVRFSPRAIRAQAPLRAEPRWRVAA